MNALTGQLDHNEPSDTFYVTFCNISVTWCQYYYAPSLSSSIGDKFKQDLMEFYAKLELNLFGGEYVLWADKWGL